MKKLITSLVFILFLVSTSLLIAQDLKSFKEITGKIIDADTKKPLVFTDIVIKNSNISTITNSDGEFLLKLPNDFFRREYNNLPLRL